MCLYEVLISRVRQQEYYAKSSVRRDDQIFTVLGWGGLVNDHFLYGATVAVGRFKF